MRKISVCLTKVLFVFMLAITSLPGIQANAKPPAKGSIQFPVKSFFVEPFSTTELKRIKELLKRKDLARYRPQIVSLLYRYKVEGSERSLNFLLRQGDTTAASIYALKKDQGKLKFVLNAFLRTKPYDSNLVQALGKWKNPAVLTALRKAFQSDSSNSAVALALAAHRDKRFVKEIRKSFFNLSDDDVEKVRLAVALCKLEPKQYSNLLTTLQRIIEQRRPLRPFDSVFAPYITIEAAADAGDFAYRNSILTSLQNDSFNPQGGQLPTEVIIPVAMKFLIEHSSPKDVPTLVELLKRYKEKDASMKILSPNWHIAEAALYLNSNKAAKDIAPYVPSQWLRKALIRVKMPKAPTSLLWYDQNLAAAIRPLLDKPAV